MGAFVVTITPGLLSKGLEFEGFKYGKFATPKKYPGGFMVQATNWFNDT